LIKYNTTGIKANNNDNNSNSNKQKGRKEGGGDNK